MSRVRIGAVSYLNTKPMVYGLERGIGAERIELSYDVPSRLADRMAGGELDVALLPVIELARSPELEILPGLGIVTHGPSRSVLLVSRRPAEEIKTLALDRESRTSNALVQVLLHHVWDLKPVCSAGPLEIEQALTDHDAAVRIGDKALFEPVPEGSRVYDLGQLWTEQTGLPFVYAVWACTPSTVDREIYRQLHASRREGSRALEAIAEAYTWNGKSHPELSLSYLRENILFRFGADEVRAMRLFFKFAASLGLIDSAPSIRLALQSWTDCHDKAATAGITRQAT